MHKLTNIQLYIYDPNFEATLPHELTQEEKDKIAAEKRNNKDWRPRLSEISSGVRLQSLYKAIKGKFAVEEIWIGGGGNQDIHCLAMCQDQLELMENGDEEAINFAWAEGQLREQLHSGIKGLDRVCDEFNALLLRQFTFS